MSQLPDPFAENNAISYLHKVSLKVNTIYILILLMVASGLICLPFIHVEISVSSSGIIRPAQERTEIRTPVSGMIISTFTKDGDTVLKGQQLVQLNDTAVLTKKRALEYEIKQRSQFIHDLELITSKNQNSINDLTLIYSAVYRRQFNRFILHISEQLSDLKKIRNELLINESLAKEKIIAPKELFDKQIENEKSEAGLKAFRMEQQSLWEHELLRYKLELAQLNSDLSQLLAEEQLFQVRSPVNGIIQHFINRYPGNFLQAGESICTVSPETMLLGECYISTREVGLLKPGQECKIQVDAFNYNYFGILTGTIIFIDNDYTLMNDQPFFKVQCSIDATQLHLSNGFTGQLKKGMTIRTRFLVAERTLWQLLYDKLDDWLNPTA